MRRLRTPADLKGKRIGAGLAGLDEYATLLYLEKLGLVVGKTCRWSISLAAFPAGWRR